MGFVDRLRTTTILEGLNMDIDHISSESGTAPTIEEKNKKVTLRAEDLAFGGNSNLGFKYRIQPIVSTYQLTHSEISGYIVEHFNLLTEVVLHFFCKIGFYPKTIFG